jgi:ABC-type spermidine/putrescine transport system permease subunit II
MVRLYSVAILLIIVCSAELVNGQVSRVTGSFNGTPFEKFIEDVESKTAYHFYFNPSHTDSLTVTASPQNQPIDALLNQVLAGTELRFVIDMDNNIYITHEREILADLPDDFFGTSVAQPTRQATNFDYTLYEKRERERKLAESKLYNIGPRTSNLDGNASLAGYVRDAANGSPVIGAAVYIDKPMIGVATDGFGYYSITLPKGRHELKIKSVGMKETERQIMLYGDGKLNIDMDEEVTALKEVIVQSERDVRVSGLQMGAEKLDIKTMKQMPLALGETDIMKVVLTLPGVQTVGEGTVGLNVRGGATNQNLILFNDATIYNPSHLFGFFSTFNPDVLNTVELYKSGINAEYGGRLSSVLDVTTREGNLKKFAGSGGISPITGRLSFEGPIIKEKASFLVGGRSTYSDWILGRLNNEEFKNSEASFYDINAHLTYNINDKNSIYLSGYMSKDRFKLNSDTLYHYGDKNLSLKWKHIINNKITVLTVGLLGVITAIVLTRPGRSRPWLEPLMMLPLGASAVTLGFGYVLTYDRLRTSPLLVLIAHTLVAFPFVVRSLLPVLQAIKPSLREAAAILGASPARVWREVDLPIIGRAMLVAAVFAFTVSMGEFGATSFIVRPNSSYLTLPIAIERYLGQPGALNFGQALAMSAILMAVTAAGFLAIERFRYADIGEF